MGSKSSRSDITCDITTISSNQQPQPTTKVLILGTSDTGKSSLFYALKRLLPQQQNGSTTRQWSMDNDQIEYEMQMTCSWVIGKIYQLMNEEERTKLDDALIHHHHHHHLVNLKQPQPPPPPEVLIPLLHAIVEQEDNLSKLGHGTYNCADILSTMWRIPLFRKFYEENWPKEQSKHYENVAELVEKIDSNNTTTPFYPLSLISNRTTGIISYETSGIYNTPLEIVDVGGRRNERRKWIHCFDDQVQTIIYLVSLSEYNQVLAEDSTTKRMEESKRIVSEVFRNQLFDNCRKILLFTKPDILVKKLKRGIEYNNSSTGGGVDTTDSSSIRSELLNVIDDYNVKLTVNSIISEYFKVLEGVNKIDSYHIVNTTSDEDVQSVCDMLLGTTTHEKTTTFIAHCLLPVNGGMKLTLYNNCMKGNFVDLQVITTLHPIQADFA